MKHGLWMGIVAIAALATGSTLRAETLNDGQVAEVLLNINEGEIDAAKMALKKSKNDDIKAFATAMESQHKDNQSASKKLLSKEKIDARKSALSKAIKTEVNDQNAMLKKAAGEFDKAYIAEQIKMHEKALKTIDEELLPNVKNSDLRTFITTTRSAVAEHLDHAKSLQTKFE